MNSEESFQLAIISRQGLTERWIKGYVHIHTPSSEMEFGAPKKFWTRSLLKPFQMAPFLAELHTLTDEQLALSTGSHSGETQHLSVLKTKNWDQYSENLVLKPSKGLGYLTGKPGEVGQHLWLHPCVGKHQAILDLSKIKGWSVQDYISRDSLYHKTLSAFLEKQLNRTSIDWATDGCGLPTPALTLKEMSSLYASLLRDTQFKRIREAMIKHPELVGGSERCDTSLMKLIPNCIAKEGADGLTVVAIEGAAGISTVVLKLEAGYDARVTQFILQTLLQLLNVTIDLPVWSPDQKFECSEEILKKITSDSGRIK